MGDFLVFADEGTKHEKAIKKPYYLLIVDDDEQIHSVTRLALGNYDFEGTPLKILSAYSASEAKKTLKKYPDTAVVLLDVVMETEDAGLVLADYIRNELHNRLIRIILRTGQPGSAPEMRVIREYDINDYKAKTELTAQRLFTSIHTALRSYRDMRTLEKSRRCLEKIIKVSRRIFEKHLLDDYINATLENLDTLFLLDESAVITFETRAVTITASNIEIISHEYNGIPRSVPMESLQPYIRNMIDTALMEEKNIYEGNRFLIYCKSEHHIVLFLAEGTIPMLKEDMELLELFARNIQTALENIVHCEKLERS